MEQLAFQIGDEFLDLLPNTSLELEEENPFLQLSDEILGPYSFPFQVPNTEKNLRLLNYPSVINARKSAGIDNVICWENGVQHSVGTLKLEQIDGNLNDQLSGTTSLYYLTGSASFYQQISGKKLYDVDFGGIRSFAQPSTSTASGWWKHVDDCMRGTIDNFDYAFYPVKNPGITGNNPSVNVGIMNRVQINAGVPRISPLNTNGDVHNGIYPFPYLIYVIRRIFEYAGYSVEGDWLNDPDAKRMTMLTLRDIPFGVKMTTLFSLRLLSTVSFDLRDYMPDIEIGAFLIAIKNRLGLYYDFDPKRKSCVIRYLKDTVAGEPEDISSICVAAYNNKIDTKGKVYKMVNQFDSGDSLAVSSVLTGLEFLATYLNLPPFAPSAINENKVVLVLRENAYYICSEDPDSPGTFQWVKYMDNIYDYDPGNSTDQVESAATTTVQEVVEENGLKAIMPSINQSGTWYFFNDTDPSFGIRLLFYHGLQPDYNGQLYPYASNHPVNCAGEYIGNYALSYTFKNSETGEEIGLYDKFWKAFLERLRQSETITIEARYPFSKKSQVKFGSPKVIRYTKFFVKKKNSVIPYNGVLKLELIRV